MKTALRRKMECPLALKDKNSVRLELFSWKGLRRRLWNQEIDISILKDLQIVKIQ